MKNQLRILAVEELDAVSGGIIIVNGHPPVPGNPPGNGGGSNDGMTGAAMFLSMNVSAISFAALPFGLHQQEMSDESESDDGGMEEIVVNGVATQDVGHGAFVTNFRDGSAVLTFFHDGITSHTWFSPDRTKSYSWDHDTPPAEIQEFWNATR
jgi:hypothetical protein